MYSCIRANLELYLIHHLAHLLAVSFFFFNDTATTEIYTLSLHDALPISQRLQKEILVFPEAGHINVDELDDAEHAVLGAQRHTDDRTSLPLGHLVDALGKARVGADIRHDQALSVFGYPPGNAFSHFQPDTLQSLGRVAHCYREVKLLFVFVYHQQRPGVGSEILRHLLHDGLQDGIEVERRSEGLGHIVEDVELLALPFTVGVSSLGHAQGTLD